jgi:hypothetical protein
MVTATRLISIPGSEFTGIDIGVPQSLALYLQQNFTGLTEFGDEMQCALQTALKTSSLIQNTYP